jgi:hypothetical protein
MYAATTGTFLQRDPVGDSDEPVFGYSHEAVTQILAARLQSGSPHSMPSRPIRPERATLDGVNPYEYVNSTPLRFTDPLGLAPEPGFWSGYWYYLWNPSRMDSDLRPYQYAALTTAAVSVTAIGGLGAASYYGITAVGTVPLSQISATVAMEYQFAAAMAAASAPLTAAQAQRLVAQSGERVVTLFTRLSQSPMANQTLHTAMDPKLVHALQNSQANQMFTARIPAILFNDMLQRELIQRQAINMGRVQEYAYVITAEGMQFVQCYFRGS